MLGPFTYNAYGPPDEPFGGGNETAEGPMFQGMAFDPAQLPDFRCRAMSPELAKWVQTDLAHFEDGLNYYTFDGENPIHQVNPLGT